MNKLFYKLFCLVILLGFNYQANASNDTTKVLFIGNSITYFNNMPFMFDSIANSKGKNVTVTMYAPGGTGFVNHYVDPNVFSLFRNTVWDIVVLQPGSGESAGASWPVNTTIQRGRILLDSIYTYSSCSKVYLYEIPYGVPSQTTYNTYFSVQATIRDSVTKMADSLHLQLIPAGECARAYYNMHQNLLLHNSYNDIHPNAYGSFLTASAFYAGIFQDTVTGCNFHSSIQQDTANKFFHIVDTVVLSHLTSWRINTYNLHANFTSSISANSVTFTNQSVNYTSLQWNFGDGNTSVNPNPTHSYTTNGVYNVKLYAYSSNSCIDSASIQINITSLAVNNSTIDFENLTLFPNPVSNLLNIKKNTLGVTNYIIYDLIGNMIQAGKLSDSITQLSVSAFPKGVYFLNLQNNQKENYNRLFIVK